MACRWFGGSASHLENVRHILSVRVLAKEGRCPNYDVHTVHTRLYGNASIVHVASDVSQDLGLETELADGFTVCSRLLGCGGRGEFNVLYAKVGEGLCDSDLCFRVKKGVGELWTETASDVVQGHGWMCTAHLLSLSQGRFDNLEIASVAQKRVVPGSDHLSALTLDGSF